MYMCYFNYFTGVIIFNSSITLSLPHSHLTLKYGISRRGGARGGVKKMSVNERQKRIAELAALYATKVTSPLPPISVAGKTCN